MVFNKFRTRIKSFSTSKGTSKPSLKSGSTHNGTFESSIPEVIVTAPKAASMSKRDTKKLMQESSTSETKDYEEFLEKARKDAEKAEKKRVREIKEARERTMSPWAGRM